MRSVSATVKSGRGSEKHNHSLDYRKHLEHTHETSSENIIELVPYRSYAEQINALYKPYIDEYNAKRDQAYDDAMKRFKAGKIKNKPKKKDFRHKDYDVYATFFKDGKPKQVYSRQLKKMVPQYAYRSLIIGFGNREDRQHIKKEDALDIFKSTVKKFMRDFPQFSVIGATVHLDERGFYHMHLDFVPLYEKNGGTKRIKGLTIGNSLDSSLEQMGFQPEKSIVNEKNKSPLLFNALRNRIYRELEESLHEHDLLMEYNVCLQKKRDPQEQVELSDWQKQRDAFSALQKAKNEAYELAESDIADPEPLLDVAQSLLKKLSEAQKSGLTGNYKVQPEVMGSAKMVLDKLISLVRLLWLKVKELSDECVDLRHRLQKSHISELETQNADLEILCRNASSKAETANFKLREANAEISRLSARNKRYKNENAELKEKLYPQKQSRIRHRNIWDDYER